MNRQKLKYIKTTFYEQGGEDSKTNRHIEDLCQDFWSAFVRFCDQKLFYFDDLVKCFPHYRKGILDARKQ